MSPVVIRVTLLSGRYHAHPWGQAQHAMGGPEWPPSSWRLLRTIAACWFEASEPPCSPEERDHLLNAIGQADAPHIWVPKASFTEIPYYQPLTLNKTEKLSEVEAKAAGKKTRPVRKVNSRVLHFDHFAVVADPNVYFVFDTDLTEHQESLLSRLLSTARYFGRTESRASFELAEQGQALPTGHYEARPPASGQHMGGTIRRHVLITKHDFTASDLWHVRPTSASPRKGKGKSTSSAAIPETPPHLVEALITAKKPVPDGTRWAQYELPREAVVHELPRRRSVRTRGNVQPAAEVVFRLFRRVPIPLLDTVVLARDFRDQAVHAYTRATGHGCLLLSGREEDGSVVRGNRHAYYLPQPTGASGGFLERFVVQLPGGEHGVEQDILDAILSVTRLMRRDTYPVLVVPEEVRPALTASPAFRWRSLTPFLAPLRHRSRRKRTDPMQQMLTALQGSMSGAPTVACGREQQVIPVLSHLYDASKVAQPSRHRFTRRAALAFDLEFSAAVEVPAAIGADAHFGLGQFQPVDGRGQRSDESGARGPLVIGDGRFPGLGILAPVARVHGVHALKVDGGLAQDAEPVEVARALRRAVMARVQLALGGAVNLPPFFSGHERDGSPARSEYHPHLAFVFDPRAARLLVLAPHGLERRDATREERRHLAVLEDALDGFSELRAGSAGRLILHAIWPDPITDPLFASSRTWQSVTPYCVTRHAKQVGAQESLALDLRVECRRRGLPEPRVEATDCRGVPGTGLMGRARLTFEVAVRGPLLLGRGRHAGLGLFEGLDHAGRLARRPESSSDVDSQTNSTPPS